MPKSLTINEMRDLAQKREGLCCSDLYVNNSTKLKWQCKYGHNWEANASNIKKGHWCPFCAGQGRLTMVDLEKLALERGGKFLSNEILPANSKLKWECSCKCP